ncbi:hypothetical protein [Bradyrhizobium jicamae]|nr:hypothetical protein [Bradyrhizobium jicamae]MBR0934760.1 hypothetical protein [Bradyrhizobium jicamae]
MTPVNGVANAAGGASGNAAVATSAAHSESVQSQPVHNSEPAQSAPAQGGVQIVSTAGSNISFSNTYANTDTSDFISAVVSAEQTIEKLWTAPSPITLNVTFNESNEGNNGFLANNSFFTTDVTYAQLKAALAVHANASVYAQDAYSTLPTNDPNTSVNGGDFSLPMGYAQMLGLASSNSTVTVTLNSYYYSGDPNLSGQDVINSIVHELTEGTMGRVGGLGDQNSFWSTMDLFRFNSSGVRDYTDGRDGVTTYFSYDGGAAGTLSGLTYNNEYSGNVQVNNGDTADFTQLDVFGVGDAGETNTLSQTDIEVMEALGWEPVSNPDVVTETGPTSIIASAGQSFAFTGGNAVTVVDAGSGIDTFTTVVSTTSGGGVSASGAGGATVFNSGTTSLTIRGTLSQINAALGTLTYKSANVGTDTITVTTTDPNATPTSVSETIGVKIGGIQNLPSGGSNLVLWTGLPAGVTEEIEEFTGPNATGTNTEIIQNLQAGGALVEIFAYLPAGVTEEVYYYTGTYGGPGGLGTHTETLIDFQNGTSQDQLFTGLPSGVTKQIEDFSGTNASGTLTEIISDYQSGDSQVSLLTNLPTGVTGEILDFSGADGTGTNTEIVENLQAGGSLVEFLAYLPTGVTAEIEYFTGANATGTHTETLIDFQNGTSQDQLFSGLPSGVTKQIEDFSGTSASGTLTEIISDYQSGGSQAILLANLPTGVTEEILDFSGADGSGTNTEAILDLQAGNSIVEFLAYLPSGVTNEVEYFTAANGTGTHTGTLINFQNGTSQYQAFTGLPSGVSEEVINYGGPNATGTKTETDVDLTGGASVKIYFAYDGTGTETQYTEVGFNASAQETGFAVYSASGTLLSGSGVEPPPNFEGAAPPVSHQTIAGTAAGDTAGALSASNDVAGSANSAALFRNYMASTFTPSVFGGSVPPAASGSLVQGQDSLAAPLASHVAHA